MIRSGGGTARRRRADRTQLSAPVFDGVLHVAYDNPRPEVAALVPTTARRVLDVGCSTGQLGAHLVERGHEVVGIELDPDLARQARERLPVVHELDVEAAAADRVPLDGAPFDAVIFADVLEHLRDPWTVADWGASLLTPRGCLVISVPNIRHLETLVALVVRRRWPYKSVGIFDSTHLRFFARENLPDLVQRPGMHITELARNHKLKVNERARLNLLAPYIGDFGTMQFIFRAEFE